MTRPSKREVERTIEQLGDDRDDTPDTVVIADTVVDADGDVVETEETVIEL